MLYRRSVATHPLSTSVVRRRGKDLCHGLAGQQNRVALYTADDWHLGLNMVIAISPTPEQE